MNGAMRALEQAVADRDHARDLAAYLEAENATLATLVQAMAAQLAAIVALCDQADRSCACPDSDKPWHAPMSVRTDSLRAVAVAAATSAPCTCGCPHALHVPGGGSCTRCGRCFGYEPAEARHG